MIKRTALSPIRKNKTLLAQKPALFSLPLQSANPALNVLMHPIKSGLERALAFKDMKALSRYVEPKQAFQHLDTITLNRIQPDLAQIRRYMGNEGYASFMVYHAQRNVT